MTVRLAPLIEADVSKLFGAYDDGTIKTSVERACTVSGTISLKRIADALDRLSDPNTPVNVYGEGFSEAIQNSIERGLRGISMPR